MTWSFARARIAGALVGLAFSVLGVLDLTSCTSGGRGAAHSGDDWPSYGQDERARHYSDLDQIDTNNVDRLKLAWSLDLQAGNTVTQPIEVNGVLYFAMGYSVVHAVDAVRGKLLGKHGPEVYRTAAHKF